MADRFDVVGIGNEDERAVVDRPQARRPAIASARGQGGSVERVDRGPIGARERDVKRTGASTVGDQQKGMPAEPSGWVAVNARIASDTCSPGRPHDSPMIIITTPTGDIGSQVLGILAQAGRARLSDGAPASRSGLRPAALRRSKQLIA